MSERPTPETDDQPIINAINDNGYQVPCVDIEFARKLERECDEAREERDKLQIMRNEVVAANRGAKINAKVSNSLAGKLNQAESERAEAIAIGQELADIASHCLGWHIDVAENFKSDHILLLSRKITDTLQRWSKLKEAVK